MRSARWRGSARLHSCGQRLRRLVERKPEIKRLVEEALRRINGRPGDARSFDALHKLLEAQAYRLAHWRVSAEEINYRRFFDINDLVGLRMEDPQVFAATRSPDPATAGRRHGHPDCASIIPTGCSIRRSTLPGCRCFMPPANATAASRSSRRPRTESSWNCRTPSASKTRLERAPLYVAGGEDPGAGRGAAAETGRSTAPSATTLRNLVNGIFIDTRNRKAFTNLYQRFLGQWMDVESDHLPEQEADHAHGALQRSQRAQPHAGRDLIDEPPGARLYPVGAARRDSRDHRLLPGLSHLHRRTRQHQRARPWIHQRGDRPGQAPQQQHAGPVFEFLRDILLLRGSDGGGAPIYGYRKQLYFALKFQQLTGPVMAKGLEDTACYVYNRFVSVNEVGGSPKEFGVELEEFHRANLQRLQQWPLLDAGHLDARHQAQRGCAHASGRALGDSAAVGRAGAALAAQSTAAKNAA